MEIDQNNIIGYEYPSGKRVYRPLKSNHGYIYLMQCNEYYKIGRSFVDPKGRVIQLQVGNPYIIELVRYDEMECSEFAEYWLHTNVFIDKWVRGEWYKLNKDDLITYDNFIKDYIEIAKQSLVDIGGFND